MRVGVRLRERPRGAGRRTRRSPGLGACQADVLGGKRWELGQDLPGSGGAGGGVPGAREGAIAANI